MGWTGPTVSTRRTDRSLRLWPLVEADDIPLAVLEVAGPAHGSVPDGLLVLEDLPAVLFDDLLRGLDVVHHDGHHRVHEVPLALADPTADVSRFLGHSF